MEIVLEMYEQLCDGIDIKGEQNIIGKRSVSRGMSRVMFSLKSCHVCPGQKSLTDRV